MDHSFLFLVGDVLITLMGCVLIDKIASRTVRPWRLLKSLFSPSIPARDAHFIAQSDQRAYARLEPEAVKSLAKDLRMTVVLWPMFTAVFLFLTLAPLRLEFPYLDLKAGIVSGIILSIVGAQVCASLVSPIACGAGAVVMGWAFGLVQAFAVGRFGFGLGSPLSGISVRTNMFKSVAGGIIGLSAPRWPEQFTLPVIFFLLALVCGAICTAGWLMSQPLKAFPSATKGKVRKRVHRTFSGIASGFLAACCIPLVLGLSQVLPFMISFGVIGGLVFGFTVWARTSSRKKGIMAKNAQRSKTVKVLRSCVNF